MEGLDKERKRGRTQGRGDCWGEGGAVGEGIKGDKCWWGGSCDKICKNTNRVNLSICNKKAAHTVLDSQGDHFVRYLNV